MKLIASGNPSGAWYVNNKPGGLGDVAVCYGNNAKQDAELIVSCVNACNGKPELVDEMLRMLRACEIVLNGLDEKQAAAKITELIKKVEG